VKVVVVVVVVVITWGIPAFEEIACKKYLHKDHRTEKPWKTTVYSKMYVENQIKKSVHRFKKDAGEISY